MKKSNFIQLWAVVFVLLLSFACKVPEAALRQENKELPLAYNASGDSINSAQIPWRSFFEDPNLKALIDSALSRNQELNIFLQEIQIANNEIKARKGEYLPFVSIQGGAGVDKVGRYTRFGALEATAEIKEGKEFPEPFTDLMV